MLLLSGKFMRSKTKRIKIEILTNCSSVKIVCTVTINNDIYSEDNDPIKIYLNLYCLSFFIIMQFLRLLEIIGDFLEIHQDVWMSCRLQI